MSDRSQSQKTSRGIPAATCPEQKQVRPAGPQGAAPGGDGKVLGRDWGSSWRPWPCATHRGRRPWRRGRVQHVNDVNDVPRVPASQGPSGMPAEAAPAAADGCPLRHRRVPCSGPGQRGRRRPNGLGRGPGSRSPWVSPCLFRRLGPRSRPGQGPPPCWSLPKRMFFQGTAERTACGLWPGSLAGTDPTPHPRGRAAPFPPDTQAWPEPSSATSQPLSRRTAGGRPRGASWALVRPAKRA